MGDSDREFLRKLLATFSVEAAQHVAVLSAGLVELETVSSDQRRAEIVETVFREVHSLKGAARAVNMTKVETVCQSLESAFSEMKSQGTIPSPERLDQLHHMVSIANAEIEAAASNQQANAPGVPARETPGTDAPNELSAPERTTGERSAIAETVRVSKAKLTSLLRQAEELVSTKAAASHRSAQTRELAAMLAAWERDWRRIRPLVRAIEQAPNGNGGAGALNGHKPNGTTTAALVELLERNERSLKSIKSQLSALSGGLEQDGRGLDRRVSELLDDMKRVSMIPFSTLLSGFPKIVRDLCRESGKEAEFVIEGGDIEADRRVLEEIKHPLVHLLRNSVDHGIELPGDRERMHKSRRATISIVVTPRSGDGVDVVMTDDGAGIDIDKVRTAALKLHLVSSEEAGQMEANQVLSLVFQSGLTTSPMITDISGRGLGLAIVREKVEKIGGAVSVESERGRGTTFRLAVPLALSTFQGLLVRAEEHFLVLPAMHSHRVLRVGGEEIKRVENREVAELDGRPVSLVRIAEVLGIPARSPAREARHNTPAVLLAWGNQRMIFVVDEILGVHEFLVKSLGPQLLRVRNISGATILPNGKIALVLNVADLIRSGSGFAHRSQAEPSAQRAKSVLVVEDSITTRMLLRGILESAGYRVRTAVDGVDALAALEAQDCDLVVADVDMPRMGGFDLTARIRANKKHAGLPVVIVTSLESRSDRERGVEVGANGYIVKSSFDQSNLLEVVQRLI
jgi:two-component system chemotaxis sensor kinase CheA